MVIGTMQNLLSLFIFLVIAGVSCGSAFADEGASIAQATLPAVNPSDTAWLLISTALVMLMTPGVALLYGGMVRTGSVVATMMHSYMKLSVVSLIWVLLAYTLAFGSSDNGLLGGLEYLGLNNVGATVKDARQTVPHLLFVAFEGMFAVITAAIITGAFAERVRLIPVLLFSTIWTTIVYAPVAHWVWGDGWIASQLKALDFAGGSVVHINAGVAGLVAALMLGRRTSEEGVDFRPHNLPQTILGASLLWFGWFGFNAGSALTSGPLASLAFINTNIAAAAGALTWFITESLCKHKCTSLGVISGSIAGLVAITPAAGYVAPMSAIPIGIGASLCCYLAIDVIKPWLGYDDSLDAFGIHGIGGLWGGLATGLFATTAVNADGADGLFYGNPALMISQILSMLAVIAYSALCTYLIITVVGWFLPFRVSEEEERLGLDEIQHGEIGYNLK